MDFQEFIQNKANELVSLGWPDDMILSFIDGAEQVKNYFGWHPASKLPPVDEFGESEYLIAYDLDGYAFSAFYSRKKGWCDDDGRSNLEIEWWCYPPKEE